MILKEFFLIFFADAFSRIPNSTDYLDPVPFPRAGNVPVHEARVGVFYGVGKEVGEYLFNPQFIAFKF